MATQIASPAPQPALEADPALTFLRGRKGSQQRHSGGVLIDHLVGVQAKLASWGCREAVCRAGLFHSVYGTEGFRHQTVSLQERGLVRQLIGAEAEELAYRFSILNTRAFVAEIRQAAVSAGEGGVSARSALSPDQDDLLHLFVANWLEQAPRTPALRVGGRSDVIRRLKPLVCAEAALDIEQVYEFEGKRAPARIERALMPDQGGVTGASVQVMDDFVPEHLRLRLTALTERNIWRYGWKAAKTQTGHGFWHSHFAGDNEDRDSCCEHELTDRPLMQPVAELWHLIRDLIAPGQIPVRVYANAHTYGGDGHIHTDCERPGHFTSIYYAHPQWEPNWSGETIFLDAAGEDIIKSVSPRPGRLVHFPGHLQHAARSPSRDCPALRSVIVIKSYLPQGASVP